MWRILKVIKKLCSPETADDNYNDTSVYVVVNIFQFQNIDSFVFCHYLTLSTKEIWIDSLDCVKAVYRTTSMTSKLIINFINDQANMSESTVKTILWFK